MKISYMVVVFILGSLILYSIIKGKGNLKVSLIELFRAFLSVFSLMGFILTCTGSFFQGISASMKEIDEDLKLDKLKKDEDLKEEFRLVFNTVYQELKALHSNDELTKELLSDFYYDSVSQTSKLVFKRFMELTERESLIDRIKEVANASILNSNYFITEITEPKLYPGSGGTYVSNVIFDLNENNELRQRRLAEQVERENSEVDSVESVLD